MALIPTDGSEAAPSDWHQPRLTDFAAKRANATVGGPFGSDLVAKDYVNSGVPVIRGQNMGWRYVDGEFAFVTPTKAKALQANLAKAFDLVFTQRGTLGQVALVPPTPFAEYVISQSQMKLTVDTEEAEPVYIYQYFASEFGQKQILESAIQTGVPHTNLGILRSYMVPMPKRLAEQRAIAVALSDADALIDSLEQLLTKKRQIKQGAMQELLTGKRRLPGFELPWIDDVLDRVVATLTAGVSVNSDTQTAGSRVPSVIKTSALKSGFFDARECKAIIPADLTRAATQPRKDTLLISRMNTPDLVGAVGYVDKDYDWLYLPDRIWMLRPRGEDCVCVRWLGYLLSSEPYKRLIADTATGTSGSMKNIAKSALLRIPVQYPEFREQEAIATVLADLDAETTALESRLTKARNLKQAMAQALLTGRIRLPVENPA